MEQRGYLALAFCLFVLVCVGGASLFGFSFNKGSLFFLVPKEPVSPLSSEHPDQGKGVVFSPISVHVNLGQ